MCEVVTSQPPIAVGCIVEACMVVFLVTSQNGVKRQASARKC